MAYRPMWFPMRIGLLDAAQSLHESKTGATGLLSKDEELLLIRGLKWAIENWKSGLEDHKTYDDAVLNLIRAALVERGLL